MDVLEQIGVVPVDYTVLMSLFSGYKAPRNKIANLEREGKLIRLKRGLYVVAPAITQELLSTELIANHLYGPSYVSMESALRYHGLIPEYVYTIRSVTLKRARRFENFVATFEYIAANDAYYPIGIRQQMIGDRYAFLIASPEKALCDMITYTSRLSFQSVKAIVAYLRDDLRFDMSALERMDSGIIEQCIVTGKKKRELTLLLKLLQR